MARVQAKAGRHLIVAIAAGTLSFLVAVPAIAASRPPDIVGITPSRASVGDLVTVTGRDFGGPKARAWVGEVPARVTAATGSRVSFIVPAGAPAGQTTVRIANPSGNSDTIGITIGWDGSLSFRVVETEAVTETIGRAGGVLVTGGIRLEIPPGALSEDAAITMTPMAGVDGSPFDATFIGGASFAPEGLTFLKPATLSLPVPAGVEPSTVVRIVAAGTGLGTHLVPGPAHDDTIQIDVWHFSIVATAVGTTGILAALLSAPPSTPEASALHAIAIANAACANEQIAGVNDGPACAARDAAIEEALDAWYRDGVRPALRSAPGAAYHVAETAFGEWLRWLRQIQVWGVDERFGDEQIEGRRDAVRVLGDQARRRLGNCTGTDLVSQLRDVSRLADLALAGAITEPLADDLPSASNGEIVEACAQVRVDELHAPNPVARGTTNTLTGRASIDVWSGPNRTDIPIVLGFDTTDAGTLDAPSAPGADGRFQAGIFVFDDAGTVRVVVRATAESALLHDYGIDVGAGTLIVQSASRMWLSPGDSTIPAGTSVAVQARLAGDDIAGRTIQFTLEGDGQLSALQATTSAAGVASITYSSPDVSGAAVVTASFDDAGTTVTGSIAITVDGSVAVTIQPTTLEMVAGSTYQFLATVTGAADPSIVWSSTCGSVAPGGAYTAPVEPGTCNVTAASVEEPGATATAIVTVVPPVESLLTVSASGHLAVSAVGGALPDPPVFPTPPPAEAALEGCLDDPAPFVAPTSSFTCTATLPGASSTHTATMSYVPTLVGGDMTSISLSNVASSSASWSGSDHVGSITGNAHSGAELQFQATDWVLATFAITIADVDGSSCGSGSSQVTIAINGQFFEYTENETVILARHVRGTFAVFVGASTSATAERLPSPQVADCPSGIGQASATVNITFERP